jgi:hypothetical protein
LHVSMTSKSYNAWWACQWSTRVAIHDEHVNNQ